MGDSPTRSTGFGVVVENIITRLSDAWEVSILGINYYGDPHTYQSKWKIYVPSIGGDVYGFQRLPEVVSIEKPDLIFIVNDPWIVVRYLDVLQKHKITTPVIVYTPVDSPHVKEAYVKPMNAAAHVITYTQFGLDELRKSGLTADASVIPHGVDKEYFYPVPQNEARQLLFAGTSLEKRDPFVVLYCSRNQPRKRVDLFIYIMARWLKTYPHDDVYFHYHGAPKRDTGWDVDALTAYWAREYNLDLSERLILTSRNLTPSSVLPKDKLKYVYSAADVYFHVCANEGWGLPIAEAMACGIPTVVPQYSALAEWPKGAVTYVPVDEHPWANPSDVDTIHRFVDVDHAVETLEMMYQDPAYRKRMGHVAHEHMQQPMFSWDTIAHQFETIFTKPRMTKKARGRYVP